MTNEHKKIEKLLEEIDALGQKVIRLEKENKALAALKGEKKDAESALRKSEAQYRELIQTVPDIIYEVDKEGKFTFVSDAAGQLGYEPRELMGRNFKDLLHRDDYEKVSREIILTEHKGKITGDAGSPKLFDERRTSLRMTKCLEARVVLKNKEAESQDYCYCEIYSWGRWSADVHSKNKEFLGSTGIIRDITERKKSQEILEYRLEFERMISTLSTHFISLSSTEIDGAINHGLQAIGEFACASRGYAMLLNYDAGMKIGEVYEWRADDDDSPADCLKNFPISDLKWFLEKIKNFETIYIPSLEQMPPEAAREKAEFALRKAESFVNVPMFYSGVLVGVLGFDYVEPNACRSDTAVLLKIAAEIFSSAIERKNREEALRSSEGRFRELADLMPETIFEIDLEGNIFFLNRNAFQTFNYTIDDLYKGINISPDDCSRFKQDMKKVIDGEDTGFREYRAISQPDRTIPVIIHFSVIVRSGKIYGLRGFILDITERKKSEDALAAEKERLSVTLRSLEEAVVAVDVDSRIVLMNKSAVELSGYPLDKALGNKLKDIFAIRGVDDPSPWDEIVKHTLKEGNSFGPFDYPCAIGETDTKKIISFSSVPIREKESKIIGAVIVLRDITDKRKMEAEVLRTQKIESIGILAGGIAHDFNNILTAITSNITLARMLIKEDSEAYADLLEAEKAAFRAKNLTQQLLTFSKGGLPVKTTALITELLKDSVEFTLRGSNVRCEFCLAGDACPIDVDVGQFSQVVNNLVINAQEAMPGGGTIKVEAANVIVGEQDKLPISPGKYVRITVKDNGIGVPKEYLQKIFDPYFTTKQRGSGLGLSIVYSIIRRHNGYISVDSEPGKGTTFYLYFLASHKTAEAGSKKEAKTLAGTGKILFMDDDEMVRSAIGRAIKQLGYEIELAADGKQAIELYKKAKEEGKPFSAVIMDLTIPGGMGGKETISELKVYDVQVKAIVSSGYSNDPVMANFKDYGFSGVVIKPYRMDELSQVLRSVIEEGKTV